MRKWELITDLFSYMAGDSFPEQKNHIGQACIIFTIAGDDFYLFPKAWPKHFRLVEEPEFTESDMIEAMGRAIELNNSMRNSGGIPVKEIIETIRKIKESKS